MNDITAANGGVQALRWNTTQNINVQGITEREPTCWRQFRQNDTNSECALKQSLCTVTPSCPVRWSCVSGDNNVKNDIGENSGMALDNPDQSFRKNATPLKYSTTSFPSSTAPSPSKENIFHVTRQTPKKYVSNKQETDHSMSIPLANIEQQKKQQKVYPSQFDGDRTYEETSHVEERSFYREVSSSSYMSGVVADGVVAAEQEEIHHNNTSTVGKKYSEEILKTTNGQPNVTAGSSTRKLLVGIISPHHDSVQIGDKDGEREIEDFQGIHERQQPKYNPIPLSLLHRITLAVLECNEDYNRCMLVCENLSEMTEYKILWCQDWYQNICHACQNSVIQVTQYESPLETAANLISPEGGNIAVKIGTVSEELVILKQKVVSASKISKSWLHTIFTLVEFGEKIFKFAEINITMEDNAGAKGWDVVKSSELISHLKAAVHDSDELSPDPLNQPASHSNREKDTDGRVINLLYHLTSYTKVLRNLCPYNAETVASAFKSLQHALVYCDAQLRYVLDSLLYKPVEDFTNLTRNTMCEQVIPVLESANRLVTFANKYRPRKEQSSHSKDSTKGKYIAMEDLIQDLTEPLSLKPPDMECSLHLSSSTMLREPDNSIQHFPTNHEQSNTEQSTQNRHHLSLDRQSHLTQSQTNVGEILPKLPHYMKRRESMGQHSSPSIVEGKRITQQGVAHAASSFRGISPPAPALVEIKKALRRNASKSDDYGRCPSEVESMSDKELLGVEKEMALSHSKVSVIKNIQAKSPQEFERRFAKCANTLEETVPHSEMTASMSIFTPSKSPKAVLRHTVGEEMTRPSPAKEDGRSLINQKEKCIKSPTSNASPRLTGPVVAMIEKAKTAREQSKMPKKDSQLTINMRLKKFANVSSKVDCHIRHPTIDNNFIDNSYEASLSSVLAHNLNIDDCPSPAKGFLSQGHPVDTCNDRGSNIRSYGISVSQHSVPTGEIDTSPSAQLSIFSSPVSNSVNAQRKTTDKRTSHSDVCNSMLSQQKPEREVRKRPDSVAEIRKQHKPIDVSNLHNEYNFARQPTATYKEQNDESEEENVSKPQTSLVPHTVNNQPLLPFHVTSTHLLSPQDTNAMMMMRLKKMSTEHKTVVKERNILKKQLMITRLEKEVCSPVVALKTNSPKNTTNPRRSRRRRVASLKFESDDSLTNERHSDPLYGHMYSPVSELLSSPSDAVNAMKDENGGRERPLIITRGHYSCGVSPGSNAPDSSGGTIVNSSYFKHTEKNAELVVASMTPRQERVDSGAMQGGLRASRYNQNKPALVVSHTALQNITSTLNSVVNIGKLSNNPLQTAY